MNPRNKWLKITGIVLNVLVAAAMLFAGSMKVFIAPPEMIEEMTKQGLADKRLLLGSGELIVALLLLIPWTSPLGTLLACGFWGGTIAFHLARNEDYTLQCAFLVMTMVGSYLRGSVPLFFLGSTDATSRGDGAFTARQQD